MSDTNARCQIMQILIKVIKAAEELINYQSDCKKHFPVSFSGFIL